MNVIGWPQFAHFASHRLTPYIAAQSRTVVAEQQGQTTSTCRPTTAGLPSTGSRTHLTLARRALRLPSLVGTGSYVLVGAAPHDPGLDARLQVRPRYIDRTTALRIVAVSVNGSQE
jgi:hypothetical protein